MLTSVYKVGRKIYIIYLLIYLSTILNTWTWGSKYPTKNMDFLHMSLVSKVHEKVISIKHPQRITESGVPISYVWSKALILTDSATCAEFGLVRSKWLWYLEPQMSCQIWPLGQILHVKYPPQFYVIVLPIYWCYENLQLREGWKYHIQDLGFV